jgi:hypothetical protein
VQRLCRTYSARSQPFVRLDRESDDNMSSDINNKSRFRFINKLKLAPLELQTTLKIGEQVV